ncbi:hypothetical protein Hanom_Chr10g00956461 [Helianthus anomalus]
MYLAVDLETPDFPIKMLAYFHNIPNLYFRLLSSFIALLSCRGGLFYLHLSR